MIKVHFKDSSEVRLMIAKKGHSLRQFAEKTGISQSYLSQLLAGTHNPSARIAYKIANGLEVDPEEIFLIKNIDTSIKEVANE